MSRTTSPWHDARMKLFWDIFLKTGKVPTIEEELKWAQQQVG